MKYMRFMGSKELTDLLSGSILQNSTKWHAAGWNSDCVGFCFFDCDEPAEKRLHYMIGWPFWVVEFESDIVMRKSYGMYRDPDADSTIRNAYDNLLSEFDDGSAWNDIRSVEQLIRMVPRKKVAEYSIRQYDRKKLRVVRIGAIVPDSREGRRVEWLHSELELEACSSCGNVYRRSEAAISRRTGDRVCPMCGTKEALFDVMKRCKINTKRMLEVHAFLMHAFLRRR